MSKTAAASKAFNIGQNIIDIALLVGAIIIFPLIALHFIGVTVLVPVIVAVSGVILSLIIGGSLVYLNADC